MKILNELLAGDIITIYALGSLCILFFLITGIMVAVTKNTNMISKKTVYKNEKQFALLYGWVYIGFSVFMIVTLVLGVMFLERAILFLLLTGMLAIIMVIVQFLLHTKFKVIKGKK